MQREFYTILHQLRLDEYSTIVDKLQAYRIVSILRCKYTYNNDIATIAASSGYIRIVQLMLYDYTIAVKLGIVKAPLRLYLSLIHI